MSDEPPRMMALGHILVPTPEQTVGCAACHREWLTMADPPAEPCPAQWRARCLIFYDHRVWVAGPAQPGGVLVNRYGAATAEDW